MEESNYSEEKNIKYCSTERDHDVTCLFLMELHENLLLFKRKGHGNILNSKCGRFYVGGEWNLKLFEFSISLILFSSQVSICI
jgi:hypothetical protein